MALWLDLCEDTVTDPVKEESVSAEQRVLAGFVVLAALVLPAVISACPADPGDPRRP